LDAIIGCPSDIAILKINVNAILPKIIIAYGKAQIAPAFASQGVAIIPAFLSSSLSPL